MLPDDAPLLVADRDRLGADDCRGRLEHPGRDLLLRRRQGHQVPDRLLDSVLLGPAPCVTEDVRRREAEQERDGAHHREQSACRRERRTLVGRRHDEDECDRESGRREREKLHAPARDRGLLPACAPQEPGRRDREDRPVDEEHHEVRGEDGRSLLVRCGDVRQRERPDDERDRHRADEAIELPRRVAERHREPEEQIREEHQHCDVDPLQCKLPEGVRMLRDEARGEHDEGERPEGERHPGRGAVAPGAPLPQTDGPEQDEPDEVDVADDCDEVSHQPPSRSANSRWCGGARHLRGSAGTTPTADSSAARRFARSVGRSGRLRDTRGGRAGGRRRRSSRTRRSARRASQSPAGS